MESGPPWWRAPPGRIPAPRLPGLFLLSWTLQLAGTGAPSSSSHALLSGSCCPAANSRNLSQGDLLVAFEHCRLHRGSLQGPGGV